MGIVRSILLKRGVRSDTFWTSPVIYRSFLKIIPLFLDTYALMKSQYWSRERIEELQNERLRTLFKDAVRVPFWRDRLDAGVLEASLSPREMLARIPVASKRELTEKSADEIIDASLLKKSDSDHTSGSTGRPFHFYQDWYASLRSFAVTERIFRTTGRRTPIVYMRARERNGFTFYRHLWFFIRGYNSIRYRMNDFQELGARFKNGFILYGYTSWVVELARQMEASGMELPIRAVMVAGEHLSASERVFIERVMKAELYTLYASREVGFLGFECERHNMHLSEEWALIEIVDEKGRALPHGCEGRIVVTTFDNRVMPFIRYEIGDVGVIRDTACACGRTLHTLDFKGRTSELIELEDNRVVSLLDIAYALGSYRDSVRQYQIIQTSPLVFVIRVVPGPSYHTGKEYVEALLIRLLHPRAQIQWEVTEIIPEAQSGKAQYFIRDF